MKKLLSLTLLILSYFSVSASTITGSLDDFYGNEKVLLYVFEESFSGERKLLATVDNIDGNFTIDFEVTETCVALLSCKRVSASIFLEPNTNYSVYLPRLGENQFFSFNNTTHVDLIFDQLPDNDLNKKISEFNWALDELVTANIDDALTPAFKLKLKQFATTWNNKASVSNSTFYKSYVNFSIANIAYHTAAPEKDLIDTYLNLNLLNCANPEFVNFVQTVFENEIVHFDLYSPGNSLKDIINKGEPADVFLDKLSNNDFLKSPKMVEIVGAVALYEVINNDVYKKPQVLNLIQGIGKHSAYTDIQTLCKNLYKAATKFEKGSNPGILSAQTFDGKTWSNERGSFKPVIIICWATWSRNSIKELLNITELHKKFGDKYNYIALNLDFDVEAAKEVSVPDIFTKISYKSNPKILDQLGIITCPHNILLDTQGNFIAQQALLYNSGLASYLAKAK